MITEQKNRIIEFISKEVSPVYLALCIRRFKEETIRMMLRTEDDLFNKEWISEGNFWLTQLAEILEPQLEKDL